MREISLPEFAHPGATEQQKKGSLGSKGECAKSRMKRPTRI